VDAKAARGGRIVRGDSGVNLFKVQPGSPAEDDFRHFSRT
jgi:hypothetical protein